MRTPGEVFEAMCPCHGEIWILGERGWKCVRKNEEDVSKKLVVLGEDPPLPVLDLLRLTERRRAYFNRFSGHAELLVTLRERRDLDAWHTALQVEAEEARVAEMEDDQRRQYAEDGAERPVDIRTFIANMLGIDAGSISVIHEHGIQIPVTNPFGPNKPVSD